MIIIFFLFSKTYLMQCLWANIHFIYLLTQRIFTLCMYIYIFVWVSIILKNNYKREVRIVYKYNI
ncbi:hypothetical protein BJ944DRAFT_272862, partial [Cunninghamella echinulata]